MAEGTCLKDLNSSTDIAATRLLTVGVSKGGGGGWGGGWGGGGWARGGFPPLTPNLTGRNLFVISRHSKGKQIEKGESS